MKTDKILHLLVGFTIAWRLIYINAISLKNGTIINKK